MGVSLDAADRAGRAASLARVLIASGELAAARPLVLLGGDDVLRGLLALEGHDFAGARRLLDEARRRDPFDPRSASARGRLSFLEKRFGEAVADLLEASLLRHGGLPDPADLRLLRAARALSPVSATGWSEAAKSARERLEREARRVAPDAVFPDRVPGLVRALISRASIGEGILDRARRLAELPALSAMGDHALLAGAAGGELRRLPAGSALYRAGEDSGEISLVLAGSVALVRDTPVGPQAMGGAGPSEFAGEEALVGSARVADARAREPVTVLGFTPEFLFEGADRAGWLRYLRTSLARRLAALDRSFDSFFPGERSSTGRDRQVSGGNVVLSPEEKSRSLAGGGLSPSDRDLFAAFAQERRYSAESLIFAERDPGDALYAIASGRVRISRHLSGGEEALAILGPGEIFGEMAILDPSAAGRSADARAHEETTLLVLTRARFEELERSDPEGCADLSGLLCRLAARRCVETAERLARWRMLAGPG
jgi:CRP-like cAMP-binding protein